MATFTPPVVYDRPPYDADATDEQKALFKFYGHDLHPRYVMVFQLSDGTFVQDVPNGFAPDDSVIANTNCNIPYPWDPDNPDAPYVRSIYVDVAQTPPEYVVDNTSHPVWIVKEYNGACEVNAATAALLTTAGYGACIS